MCKKAFGFKDGLARHIRMVHQQDRPFQCPYCYQAFKTKSHLQTHCIGMHPESYRKDQAPNQTPGGSAEGSGGSSSGAGPSGTAGPSKQ